MSAFEVEQAIPVLVLRGELDIVTKDQLCEALAPSVARGGPIVLDLRELTFADSSALGLLLSTAAEMGERGTMILYGAHGIVRRAMEIICLNQAPGICMVPAPGDSATKPQ
jgi:anti-anti-sigma factor